MAQILTQDPGSNEAQSPLIVGITEGLNKLSSILNLKTSKLEDVSLTAVSIDDTEDNKNRIFEAPTGNRLWLSSPAPTFKKNGSPITQESSGFTIDYVGGSITFQKESKPSDGDTITVSATYIIAESEQLESILSGLSSAQTQANKYKGNYASYDSLILDIPSGKNGDFAIVFDPLAVYAWKNDGWYDTRSIEDLSNYYTKEEADNLINQKEPSITQKGSFSSDDNYYWGGRKTWQDLFAKVRSVTLTGLSTASDAVVSATDTVLVAIGKLQAQVSKATQRAYLSGTGAPTTSTVGAIGQRYINTSNGDEYTCEAISGDIYTWRMHTRRVNGKFPTDAGGNIQLTYDDVGALAEDGTSINSENSMKLGGYPPNWWVPIGLISPFGGSFSPDGWLLCDGSAISRTEYAALFDVIGTVYGAGDGSSTFNLPDLRGRTAVGAEEGASRGTKTGAKEVTLTVNQLPAHQHGVGVTIGTSASTDPAQTQNFLRGAWYTETISINTTAAGSGQAHNNMQPSLYINYIIKT